MSYTPSLEEVQTLVKSLRMFADVADEAIEILKEKGGSPPYASNWYNAMLGLEALNRYIKDFSGPFYHPEIRRTVEKIAMRQDRKNKGKIVPVAEKTPKVAAAPKPARKSASRKVSARSKTKPQ